MLSASRKIALVNNSIRRICLFYRESSAMVSRRPAISQLGRNNLFPGCNHSYVSLSSVKYEVIGTKETLSEAKDENRSEESTESTYDTRTSNGRNARTSFKFMGQNLKAGVPEGSKFRNYSSSDFQNASSLREEFNSLLEQQGNCVSEFLVEIKTWYILFCTF